MTGIIPDAVKGGVAVVDGGGNPTNPPGVTNAYIPPSTFTMTCTLRYYGSDCASTRYDPQQINAIESELLCLAATMNPTGSWSCGTLCNLGNAFTAWSSNIQMQLKSCAGVPLVLGDTVPTCAEFEADQNAQDIVINQLLSSAHTPATFTPADAASGVGLTFTPGGPDGQQFTYSLAFTVLAQLLTDGTNIGSIVTDDLFRAALGTGQDRLIHISRADTAGIFNDTGNIDGSALIGLRSGAAAGNGVSGTKTTVGFYGAGLYGEEAGSGGYGVIGYASSNGALGAGYFLKPAANTGGSPALFVQNDSAFGNGQTTYSNATAGYFESNNNIGVHAASNNASVGTGFFQNVGNGIYATLCTVGTGLLTNGNVAANSFIVTSDISLKFDIEDINADAALKLQEGIRWVEYSKNAIEMSDAPDRFDSKSKKLPKKKAGRPDPSRQSGVIAQELQKLTAEIGAFSYLVVPLDPNDKNSILSVDYGSLYAILSLAERERNKRLEARIAKLEGK